MSEIQKDIVGSIREYLNNSLSLDDFRLAFAGAYFVKQEGLRDEAANLMNGLIGPFGEFSAGHKSEASLREDLKKAIRFFEEPLVDWDMSCSPTASQCTGFPDEDLK